MHHKISTLICDRKLIANTQTEEKQFKMDLDISAIKIMLKFMFKNILRLLAASTSFVALLLITNSAIALSPNEDAPSQTSVVNLNLVSPSLTMVSNSDLNSHLGCSCATCVEQIQNI